MEWKLQVLHYLRLSGVKADMINWREFKEDDLVLKKMMLFHNDSRGKWTPNYERLYGEEIPRPVNTDAVKKYSA